MPTTSTIQPVLSDLPRAIAERDAAAQAALYAEDAVVVTIDADHGPSDPTVARGREAIAAAIADVCARDITHEVTFLVEADDAGALSVACRHADGTRVHCIATLRLRDGLIVEQTTVQAWDS